jgi:Protein of unknown function (DUF3014)
MDDTTPQPLEEETGPIYTSRRRQRRLIRDRRLKLFGLLVVVVAVGIGAWLWRRSRTGPAVAAPLADTLVGPAAAAPAPPPTNPTLPPLDSSDVFVRGVVSGLSSHPQLASWLATDKLIHRFVVTVVAVANGGSPEEQVGFLKPRQPFETRTSGNTLVEDTADYHRYDAMTLTLVSLDSAGVGKLYRELSPLMEDAYHELGLKAGTTFQESLARAFGRLLAVRFPDEPPALVQKGPTYDYASPQLASLSAAAKHLLRLGPTNGREVQDKLRQLAGAMGIAPVAPAEGAA